jgi:hypothetical protein
MGRPVKFERAASHAIRVRVTPQQRQALHSVARENRTRISDVIRDAVNTYVSDYKETQVFRGPKPNEAATVASDK